MDRTGASFAPLTFPVSLASEELLTFSPMCSNMPIKIANRRCVICRHRTGSFSSRRRGLWSNRRYTPNHAAGPTR